MLRLLSMLGHGIRLCTDRLRFRFCRASLPTPDVCRESIAVDPPTPLSTPAHDEIAAILPLLGSMSELVRDTAMYMQSSVHKVSGGFSSIVDTARGAVDVSRQGLTCYGNRDQVLDMVGRSLQKMDDIADEARIVGINGRLEAVRAGQFGAAFNVVAMETTNLSVQTSTASRRIRESLSKLSEMHHGLLLSMKKTEELSVNLSGDIASTVIGLQFQDLAFQRLIAVSDALDALSNDLQPFAKFAHGEAVEERSSHWLDWFHSRPGLPPEIGGGQTEPGGGQSHSSTPQTGTVELF
ncbi:MAG: hypothetical protein JNL58_06550 [Planctomyces sp.]|nr:hypothetical protein [Planctomyces sp.]